MGFMLSRRVEQHECQEVRQWLLGLAEWLNEHPFPEWVTKAQFDTERFNSWIRVSYQQRNLPYETVFAWFEVRGKGYWDWVEKHDPENPLCGPAK